MPLPTVSIIIVSYNRREDLRHTLRSLDRIDYPDFEILVLDNGSGDGAAEMVLDEFPDVRLFASEANLGACVARNIGVLHSIGQYIWFLDNDVEIASDTTLRDFVTILEQDSSIGAIGGEAIVDEKGDVVGTKRLRIRRNGAVQGDFLTELAAGELSDTNMLATCNMLMRRDVFLEVGGFDPEYFFYFEDCDFSLRLRRRGLRLVVPGKVPVIHRFSPTTRVNTLRLSARNRMYFVLKNFRLKDIILLPIHDLLFLLNPQNLVRLKRRAKTVHLGDSGFVRQETGSAGKAGLAVRVGKLAVAVANSVGTLLAGYFLVWPVLLKAVRMRKCNINHLRDLEITTFQELSSMNNNKM